MLLHAIAQAAAIGAALLAAALWAIAARVKVEPGRPAEFLVEHTSTGGRMIVDGLELRATLQKQAEWNTKAAAVTAVSVLLQAAATYLTP